MYTVYHACSASKGQQTHQKLCEGAFRSRHHYSPPRPHIVHPLTIAASEWVQECRRAADLSVDACRPHDCDREPLLVLF
eukprot:COSAG03_NODE_12599_length_540_cov_0.537415_1_plen_78_part_10